MKACLVIGASRGIGRQIALTLSANGYTNTIASLRVFQDINQSWDSNIL
jgi:NAD(P)-dependent dehydrogenase (short-subunit alcohol dehydrogenase family)